MSESLPHLGILVATMGLPRSGKTTWAQAIAAKHRIPIVSPDAIRLAYHGNAFDKEHELAIWGIARVVVRSLFLTGHTRIILDATNTTLSQRLSWRDPNWSVVYQPFYADSHECRRRALASNRGDLFPVIANMDMRYDNLRADEELFDESRDLADSGLGGRREESPWKGSELLALMTLAEFAF